MFKKIRHAIVQADTPDMDFDRPSDDYLRGYNDASRWYDRVIKAVEHGLICPACGMPSHRGAGKAALDKMLGVGATVAAVDPVDGDSTS